MKRKGIRLLALLLATAMLMIALCACGNPDDNGKDTSKDPSDTTAPNVVTTTDGGNDVTAPVTDEFGREVVEPDIPSVSYGGRDFVVHTRGNVEQYEWFAERYNGDPLNDAIYARNKAVEDKLYVNIVCLAEGSWSDYTSNTLPRIKANIKSGEGAYDLIAGFSTPISSLATTGLLLDLNEVEYIDFEKPWWNTTINDAMTIDNVLYFGVGSLSLSMIYSMYCIVFNKTLLNIATNDGKDLDIYGCVESQEWTIDKMIELSDKVYLDSDGLPDASDRFGIYFEDENNTILGYLRAFGITYITRDTDDTPILNIDKQAAGNAVDKIIKLLYNTPGAVPANLAKSLGVKFSDGKVLFKDTWLYYVHTDISQQTSDYGILPMPKYDTKQKDYMTKVQSGMHIYCIPRDVKDPEANGIITEALAAESYKSLVPAYYEICLKSRYSQDEASSRMIDIINNTVTIDMADIYTDIGITSLFTNVIKAKTNVISSSIDSRQKTLQSKIDDLIDGVRNPKD